MAFCIKSDDKTVVQCANSFLLYYQFDYSIGGGVTAYFSAVLETRDANMAGGRGSLESWPLGINDVMEIQKVNPHGSSVPQREIAWPAGDAIGSEPVSCMVSEMALHVSGQNPVATIPTVALAGWNAGAFEAPDDVLGNKGNCLKQKIEIRKDAAPVERDVYAIWPYYKGARLLGLGYMGPIDPSAGFDAILKGFDPANLLPPQFLFPLRGEVAPRANSRGCAIIASGSFKKPLKFLGTRLAADYVDTAGSSPDKFYRFARELVAEMDFGIDGENCDHTEAASLDVGSADDPIEMVMFYNPQGLV